MSKDILYSNDARVKMKSGIDAVANAVKVTLGPKGRNVIIERPNSNPHITKDGVTVAKEIELEDLFENMGAQIVKEVASKTNDEVGDGTSTSSVLTQAIITEGIKVITAGANPMDVKRGIDKGVAIVVNSLRKQSVKISNQYDKVKQVGTISANNDEFIGTIIAEAMSKIGEDGVITVEEAHGVDTEVKVVEGMQFDRGYISPYFITDEEKQESVLNNPIILIVDGRLSSSKEVVKILEIAHKSSRSLLIIADDIDGDALSTIILNKIKGVVNVAAVKSPNYGVIRKDTIEDIAILSGGTVIGEHNREYLTTLKDDSIFGSAEKVVISKDNCTIINGNGNKETIASRVAFLKSQYSECNVDFIKETLETRIGRLSGGIAVIYVGAATEVEMKEKKDRIDDALCATKAAVQEGVVPGGGVAYIRAAKELENATGNNYDETIGIKIIAKAIECPLRQIASNCGDEASVIINTIKNNSGNYGYNALTGKYVDMFEDGVLDPTKVSRLALQNSASVASMFLTTECAIANKK